MKTVQYRIIFFLHLSCFRKQRMADVSAYIHSLSGCAQHLGDDSGCRGFSIAPVTAMVWQGQTSKKTSISEVTSLPRPQRIKLRNIRTNSGRTENDILIQTLKIVLSQFQCAAPFLQPIGQISKCASFFFGRMQSQKRHIPAAVQSVVYC